MHRHRHNPRFKRPWNGLHGILWIIGLVLLARHGWWWPGILVLIGISMIIESALSQGAPQVLDNPEPPKAAPPPFIYPPPAAPAPFSHIPVASGHRVELLPATCSRCGAPIRAHEVKWTGTQSAACPYCGSTLAMKKI